MHCDCALHEVREFAGHADIRTTEVYFIRKEEDAEVAARRIQIRVTGRKGRVSPAAAVPTILAAERAGGQWNEWIRWMGTYTMPKTGDRLPFGSQGERP